jgi:hypothetical protein
LWAHEDVEITALSPGPFELTDIPEAAATVRTSTPSCLATRALSAFRPAKERDVTSTPKQAGEPLNYLVYPGAEAYGKPVENIPLEVSYRDIP